ncbi:hypothetical protein DICPUDRAFT_88529 [Dictyostelium purpureum]|uniref:Uncharacterized protein n=1 Tax=Dictyostelium purpureum TaxID=5786 RepID=F0ZPY8_DICPU|nr:uncharacterized protein DICPUDRAFT_88529 [Dictyostelium purpureum]EGC34000.1 hypothetical protein DICPUDRAFT_88529 [Dictyostelium purpureum]|eukprot:XP_003289486.1 hypothetical protein DICPUDRAFT_88529 [Dictyostelium purpureum]
MGRQFHHHHHHHKRHSYSNCCIGINTIFFLITFIAGAVITAAVFVPSVEYKDEWLKLNATLIDKPSLDIMCQNSSCVEQSNQVSFPYYFYDHGKTFPYEYDKGEEPIAHKNATEPTGLCPNAKHQCWNTSISFQYHANETFILTKSLYVSGDWQDAYDFNQYFTSSLFPCWVSIKNSTEVSVVPIPRYSPGAAIAVGVLFSFALLFLIIILVLISIRCFCKQTHHGHYEYQPISSY